jgi:hypothetical protein
VELAVVQGLLASAVVVAAALGVLALIQALTVVLEVLV